MDENFQMDEKDKNKNVGMFGLVPNLCPGFDYFFKSKIKREVYIRPPDPPYPKPPVGFANFPILPNLASSGEVRVSLELTMMVPRSSTFLLPLPPPTFFFFSLPFFPLLLLPPFSLPFLLLLCYLLL